MKKGTLLVCFGALAVALLMFAGCGGDDDSSSLTKDEFVAEANAICKKGTEERNQKFKQASAETKPDQTFSDADREQVVLDILVPPYQKVTEELEGLGTPEEGGADVEAITEAREKAIQKVEADPGAAVESVSQFTEANKLSAEYGLTDCVV